MSLTCDIYPVLDDAGRLNLSVQWPSEGLGEWCSQQYDSHVKFFAQRKFSREVSDTGDVKWTREAPSATIMLSDGIVITANIHDLSEPSTF